MRKFNDGTPDKISVWAGTPPKASRNLVNISKVWKTLIRAVAFIEILVQVHHTDFFVS